MTTKQQMQTLLRKLNDAGVTKVSLKRTLSDLQSAYQQHCEEVSERKLTRFLHFTDLSKGKHDPITLAQLTQELEPEEVNYAIAWGMLKATKMDDGEIDLKWVRPSDRPMYFHLWNH